MAQFSSQETIQTARFLQARARKQLSAFYAKPYAVVSSELLATIVAVILLGLFAIRPTMTTMAQLVRDIEDRRETLDALTRKVAALSTLQSELPSLQASVTRLHRAIPDQPDLDGALRRIEFLASQNNVIIEGLRVPEVPSEQTAETVDDEIQSLQITLNVRGDYFAVSGFLSSLLSMDRYVLTDNIVMQTTRDASGVSSGEIVLNVTLQTIYRGTAPAARAGR